MSAHQSCPQNLISLAPQDDADMRLRRIALPSFTGC
jgi:hypothetical protein